MESSPSSGRRRQTSQNLRWFSLPSHRTNQIYSARQPGGLAHHVARSAASMGKSCWTRCATRRCRAYLPSRFWQWGDAGHRGCHIASNMPFAFWQERPTLCLACAQSSPVRATYRMEVYWLTGVIALKGFHVFRLLALPTKPIERAAESYQCSENGY